MRLDRHRPKQGCGRGDQELDRPKHQSRRRDRR